MNSAYGLGLSQLGPWAGVQGFAADPELGEGRRPPGAPPVFLPVQADPPGRDPVRGFLRWATPDRPRDLGPHLVQEAPATGPPAHVPPAWAAWPTPDEEIRYGSPSVGNY